MDKSTLKAVISAPPSVLEGKLNYTSYKSGVFDFAANAAAEIIEKITAAATFTDDFYPTINASVTVSLKEE